jgi:hypothetical protein
VQRRQRQSGLNKVKASAFRRRPVPRAYSPEQTTRFTGGHDCSEAGFLNVLFLNSAFVSADKKLLNI